MSAPQLQDELDRLVPDVGTPDWGDVLARAETTARARRLRAGLVAVALLVPLTLAFMTPLGAAIAHGVGDFSAWLTGQPGEPVSAEEQRQFDEANARTWLGFPKGTQLRRLATTEAAGTKVELLGFRSGETFCLRIVASGATRGSTQSCAPLRELRSAGAPVRVVVVDHGFGRGDKREWYGVNRVTSSLLQVSAGIVADGVEWVELTDEGGTHRIAPTSNAFLYVAAEPEVAQRVRAISARTTAGRFDVPFAPAPFGLGGGPAGERRPVPGPTTVERTVRTGTIGWLERREIRGESLDVLPVRQRRHIERNAVFGRVLSPTADRPLRVAVTLNTSSGGARLEPSGVCTWLVTRGGSGGGCSPLEELFARGPVTLSLTLEGGSDEFATVVGLVSDDVERLVAYLGAGEEIELPIVDNAYAAVLARAELPGRIAAYDGDGKVIGLTDPIGDVRGAHAGPAPGRATSLLKAESPKGSTAELLVGPSSTGGECMYIRYRGQPATGTMTSCTPPDWSRYPLLLNTYGDPGEFVMGQVRPDLVKVEIRYADGASSDVTPVRGYVLFEVPAAQLEKGKEALTAAGFDRSGTLVGTWSFRPPPKRP